MALPPTRGVGMWATRVVLDDLDEMVTFGVMSGAVWRWRRGGGRPRGGDVLGGEPDAMPPLRHYSYCNKRAGVPIVCVTPGLDLETCTACPSARHGRRVCCCPVWAEVK